MIPGIVAAGGAKRNPIVALSDRLIPGTAAAAIRIDRSLGALRVLQGGSYDQVPGEWMIDGTTPASGAWQFRVTPLAGANPTLADGGRLNQWEAITNTHRVVYQFGGGRFRLEIRDAATQAVQATAQFYTSSFAP